MKISGKRRSGERGATMFEAVLAICILMLFFFAVYQIYLWSMAEIFCQYSVFYGSKGAALGYRPNIALRGARVAAIAVSGGHGGGDEETNARSYMSYGDASGVSYPYWHPQNSTDPWLDVGGTNLSDQTIDCYSRVRNMPLVHDAVGRAFAITKNPEPGAENTVYNFSKIFLEEE